MDEFAPEVEIPQQVGDDFQHSVEPVSGFADAFVSIHYEVAGGTLTTYDRRPLQAPPYTVDECVDLHSALAVWDRGAFLYAARRHTYLGVHVLTLCVQIGLPGAGRVRLEHKEPADGFVTFATETTEQCLPILSSVGQRLMRDLCDQAMAEVVAVLKDKE